MRDLSLLEFTELINFSVYTNLELDLKLVLLALSAKFPHEDIASAVERVTEYLDLPQEPPAIIESNRPPAYWPSGNPDTDLITIEDLTVRYSPELPAVLRNVSVALKGGERIGLLGRTGMVSHGPGWLLSYRT